MTEKGHRPVRPTGFNPTGPVRKPPPAAAVTLDDAVAARVKVCYEVERARWESRKSGHPVVYEAASAYDGTKPKTIDGELVIQKGRRSEWKTMAEWCEEKGVDPEAYIRLVFDHARLDLRSAPEPNNLRSEKCLAIWAKYSPRLLDDMAVRLVTEKSVASAEIASYQVVGIAKEDSYSAVLMNRHVAISPLMRYCLAKSIGGLRFRRIAARFEPEAVMQFMRYRQQYAAVWKDVLPKGFAARAKRIYPHLVKALAE